METKIKKWGDSKVIVLTKEFCEIRGYNVNDILDISDIFKLEKNKFMSEED